MTDIQVVDWDGKVRKASSYTEAEINSLDDTKVARLHAVIAASEEAEAAEKNLTDCDAALKAAIRASDATVKTKAKEFPPLTHLDLMAHAGIHHQDGDGMLPPPSKKYVSPDAHSEGIGAGKIAPGGVKVA